MSNKAKLNFAVDVFILIAFVLSALSGLVLFTMPHSGYQNGRNLAYYQAVLLLSRAAWNDLHVWSSFAMVAGALVHLLLHWKWMVCMVKKMLRLAVKVERESCPVTAR
ncbi:MAG: hypothetical protein DRI52_06280 [Chloroflexi bacterium]|nr:MAG: hypothetical protein DRI52_06280 [Chloroflexota bacterium]